MPSVQGFENGTTVIRITLFVRWGWRRKPQWIQDDDRMNAPARCEVVGETGQNEHVLDCEKGDWSQIGYARQARNRRIEHCDGGEQHQALMGLGLLAVHDPDADKNDEGRYVAEGLHEKRPRIDTGRSMVCSDCADRSREPLPPACPCGVGFPTSRPAGRAESRFHLRRWCHRQAHSRIIEPYLG